MNLSFYLIFYYFVVYSFSGWITEVIYAYSKKNRFINRGFLFGPFCPIYGLGMVSILLFLDIMNVSVESIFTASIITIVKVFLYIMIITTLLEYVTGRLMELVFHTKWWDYSNRRFNIKGMVCLKFSVLWGIGGFFIIYGPNILITKMIYKIPVEFGTALIGVFIIYFIIDGIYTVKGLINFKNLLAEMYEVSNEIKGNLKSIKVDFVGYSGELREEISRKIEKLLNNATGKKEEIIKLKYKFKYNFKRYNELGERISKFHVFKAFPDMKSKKIEFDIKKIKQSFEERVRR